MAIPSSPRRAAARTRRCEGCGQPFAKAIVSSDAVSSDISADPDARTLPCRFCGHGGEEVRTPFRFATVHLRLAFDGMPPSSLDRIKLALAPVGAARSLDSLQSAVAPICPPLASWIGLHHDHEAATVHATVTTVVDVLQTLAVTEDRATPDQLHDTVVNVIERRLDRLPLPQGSPCFCDRSRRYADCHGRRTA